MHELSIKTKKYDYYVYKTIDFLYVYNFMIIIEYYIELWSKSINKNI